MNLLEHRMVDTLKDLKENYSAISVKAEFEAEGTRLEEAMRLKDVISKADLDFTIKIGGCEAVRDIYEARSLGVSSLVAPMIESPYAFIKFMTAVSKAITKDETISYYVNIETIDGFKNYDAIIALPEINNLTGIVVGRGDMACSLGLTREDVNADIILEITKEICQKAKQRSLRCTIGGGVSADTLFFIQKIPPGIIDCYETRKIIFNNSGKQDKREQDGILKAVGFEMMWLKNKRDYYGIIFEEDKNRLNTLQNRYRNSIAAAGGKYE